MSLTVRKLVWENTAYIKGTRQVRQSISRCMGVVLTVQVNEHGKYNAVLNNGYARPEAEHNFETLAEAKRYAERVLLAREIQKYFIGKVK